MGFTKKLPKWVKYMSPIYLILHAIMKGKKLKAKHGDITKIETTQAEEGSVIPIAYGTVKVAGNVVYYGNYREKVNKTEEAKGLGGDTPADEVETIIDVHMILAKGTYSVDAIYLNDEVYTPNASVLVNSTTLNYSTKVGAFTGLTHVFLKDWNIGTETTIPNLQFKLTRSLSHVPSWAKPSSPSGYGANPASIIYDILHECGIQDSQMNQTSFTDSVATWNIRNWEINWVFSEQKNMDESIKEIFSQVMAFLYKDANGLYYLKAFDTSETATITIDERDLKELTLERQSLDTVTTDFVATYKDQYFVERTCHISNEVVSNQVGKISKTVDYKGFRKENIQSRLNLDLRMESYPTLKIKAKLPLYYNDSIFLGTLFKLECTSISLPERTYRVISVKRSSTEIGIEIDAEEFPTHLIDAYQIDDNDHSEDDYKTPPEELDYVHTIPYPKTATYPNHSLLLLFTQKIGNERTVKLDGEFNSSGVYKELGVFNGWSEHGILVGNYDTGYDIDDAIGFDIEIDSGFDTSILANITRHELLTNSRYIVVGNELMKFQTATLVTPTKYHITGVVRATTQIDHLDGEHIYVGYIGGNILTGIPSKADLNLKFLPKTRWETLSDATPYLVSYEMKPYPVTRIEAVRVSNIVTISIIPNTQNPTTGWGVEDETLYIDYGQPYPILGQLLYSDDNITYYATTNSVLSVDESGSFTFYVKHLYNGRESSVKSVFVDTADGTYIGG